MDNYHAVQGASARCGHNVYTRHCPVSLLCVWCSGVFKCLLGTHVTCAGVVFNFDTMMGMKYVTSLVAMISLIITNLITDTCETMRLSGPPGAGRPHDGEYT